MNKKEEFKEFVRKNPQLIKHVNNESMSWQKFYEIYDLYGDKEDVWEAYIKKEKIPQKEEVKETGTPMDLIGWLKGIDLDSVQNGVNSLQRVLALVGDFSAKDTPTKVDEYKPRPLYKHFED